MHLETVRHTLNGVDACVGTLEEEELAKLLESLWKHQNNGKMPGNIRVRMVEDVRKSMTQFDTSSTGSLTFEQFLRLVQVTALSENSSDLIVLYLTVLSDCHSSHHTLFISVFSGFSSLCMWCVRLRYKPSVCMQCTLECHAMHTRVPCNAHYSAMQCTLQCHATGADWICADSPLERHATRGDTEAAAFLGVEDNESPTSDQGRKHSSCR